VSLIEDMGPTVVLGDKATQPIHYIGVQIAVSLHPVAQRVARVEDVQLSVDGWFSVRGEEGTNSVVEFSVNLEHGGATSTSIDTVVNLSTERGEGECRVVLADVFTELLRLWRRCREEASERVRWGWGSR